MDWTHTLTIIGALSAFMMFISSRADKRMDAIEARVESGNKDLNDKIEALQKDVNQIAVKVSNIEGQLTQITRPGVIPFDQYYMGHRSTLDGDSDNKKAQGQ